MNLKKAYLLLTLNSSLLSIIHLQISTQCPLLSLSLRPLVRIFPMITLVFFLSLSSTSLYPSRKIIFKASFYFHICCTRWLQWIFIFPKHPVSSSKNDWKKKNSNHKHIRKSFIFFVLVIPWLFQFKCCNNSFMRSNHH